MQISFVADINNYFGILFQQIELLLDDVKFISLLGRIRRSILLHQKLMLTLQKIGTNFLVEFSFDQRNSAKDNFLYTKLIYTVLWSICGFINCKHKHIHRVIRLG